MKTEAKKMKFQPRFIEQILAGRKTQTRRPVKPQTRPDHRETLCSPYGDVGELLECDGLILRITGLRLEKIKRISHADIHAEGFANYKEFADAWDGIYEGGGYGWHTNPQVWVYEFELFDIPQPPKE